MLVSNSESQQTANSWPKYSGKTIYEPLLESEKDAKSWPNMCIFYSLCPKKNLTGD